MDNSYPVIRARVPLRLGLAGGGTDLSPYCDSYGGAVLNATVDRYAYATIEPSEDGQVHFCAPDLEIEEVFPADLDALEDACLILHAGVTRRMIKQFAGSRLPPLKITSFVDAPAGSGLGSSSALVVALVEAFRAFLSVPLGPYDVAHIAFEVERNELNLAGGKQDQYAGTFGGINFLEFLDNDRVIVNPLRVPTATLNELQMSMVICFTGVSRRSNVIIEDQQRRMQQVGDEALASLHRLKEDAIDMKDALLRGQVPRMAQILNRSWIAKQKTAAGVSNRRIDQLFQVASEEGALGGKVSGAGGGGFMMFIVPPTRRVPIIRALNKREGQAGSVHLVATGAEAWRV